MPFYCRVRPIYVLPILILLVVSHPCFAAKNQVREEQPCPRGQYSVRSHPRRAYTRTDGTRVAATNVRASCRTLTKTDEVWLPRLHSSFPGERPQPLEKAKPWSEEERERLLEVLNELPESIVNSKVRAFVRAVKSKVPNNPATWDNGYIFLYDEAFHQKHTLGRIVAHEMAHQVFRDLPGERQEDYRFATNWYATDSAGSMFIQRTEGYVQDDGRVSPEEDFANNVEYLLFDEPKLLKETPQAHRWLKSYFGDKFKIRKSTSGAKK